MGRARIIVAIAGALVLVAAVVTFAAPALATLLVGGTLYYLLAPAVGWLERHRVPRLVSALAFVGALVGAVTTAFVQFAPRAYAELVKLAAQLPSHVDAAQRAIDTHPSFGEGRLNVAAHELLERAEGAVTSAAPRVLGWMVSAVSAALPLALGLMVALYLLASGPSLAASAVGWIPPERRDAWVRFGRAASRVLSGYVRARVLASAFIGVSYGIAFALLGVEQPVLLAVVGGLCNLVPILGPLLAAIPAVAVAAMDGVGTTVGVSVVMLVAQQIESGVIGPLVEGRFVRLPPVVVVLSVALAGALFGIPGTLVAVPLAALAREALEVFYRSSWREAESAAPG